MRDIKFRFYVKKDKCMISNVRVNSDVNDTFKSDSSISMQYIGIRDMDGVAIYESDVLARFINNSFVFYKVAWDDLTHSFMIIELSSGTAYYELREPEKYTVIGNIHENADLLGG